MLTCFLSSGKSNPCRTFLSARTQLFYAVLLFLECEELFITSPDRIPVPLQCTYPPAKAFDLAQTKKLHNRPDRRIKQTMNLKRSIVRSTQEGGQQPALDHLLLSSHVNSCSWLPRISNYQTTQKKHQCRKDDPLRITLWASARFCSKPKPPRTSLILYKIFADCSETELPLLTPLVLKLLKQTQYHIFRHLPPFQASKMTLQTDNPGTGGSKGLFVSILSA